MRLSRFGPVFFPAPLFASLDVADAERRRVASLEVNTPRCCRRRHRSTVGCDDAARRRSGGAAAGRRGAQDNEAAHGCGAIDSGAWGEGSARCEAEAACSSRIIERAPVP